MPRFLILTIFSLLAGSLTAFFYYAKQVSEVPQWYQVKSYVKQEIKDKDADLAESPHYLKQKIKNFENRQEVTLNLSSGEINEFIKLILLKEFRPSSTIINWNWAVSSIWTL
jgi:Skp family chaperone for outer membrane proteins